jgi:multidrug transporter EmrE-like cation transporter
MPTQNPLEDNTPDPSSSQIALRNWQQSLMEENGTPAGQTGIIRPAVAEEMEEPEEESDLLACNLCYRPFQPDELTVASNERFNWEAAVVVCKECLTELKLEMRAKSSGPDLVLGVVWAAIGFVLTTAAFSLAIWSVKTNQAYTFWQWIGSYFAFVPGFIIGRLVRYGVGRRQSLEQQLIAIFFTLGAVVLIAYVGLLADNNNFMDTVMQTTAHRIAIIDFWVFLTVRFWPALTTLNFQDNFLMHLGIILGTIAGILAAYFSSEGARIYTRPFVR